jgi:hypothetical protein
MFQLLGMKRGNRNLVLAKRVTIPYSQQPHRAIVS